VVKDWRVDVHYNIPLSRPAASREEKVSTNFDLCNARHHSSEIFADGQIAARQFLQCADACSAVIDRAEFVHVQPVSQLACIDPVILVPLIVILGKVSVREISTVVVARACLWKCEKFEFADRLHWRRQASRGHEYVPLTLDVY
jgi:hypothetical protein